jgi:hypothetical protein
MTWPVTLIDDGKGLLSGWLLSLDLKTEELFQVLLQSFDQMLGHAIRNILTVEDSVMRTAIVSCAL